MAMDTTSSNGRDDISDAEIVEAEEVGRLEILKTRTKDWTKAKKEQAQTALAAQHVIVRRRVADWFGAADATDEVLAQEIEARRVRELRQGDAALEGQIKVLKHQLREAQPETAAGIAHRLAGLEAQLTVRREFEPEVKVVGKDLIRARRAKKAGRAGVVALGGLAYVNGVAAEPLLALASLGAVPAGWWWLARPFADDEHQEQQDQVLIPGQVGPLAATGQVADFTKGPAPEVVDFTKPEEPVEPPPYGGTTVSAPVYDAPPPPALDQKVLTEALRRANVIRPDAEVTVLTAPAWEADGTATTVFDLPAGVTVAMLQKKAEALAGAMGRDLQMIDITKAGAAGRASLWISDADPFEEVRPSPLLSRTGAVDVWRDGAPVGWAKRGQVIALPIKNSHFLIGGMTRSGKGVGLANLVAGATLDYRVNLRVVAGKDNGEFDAYARAGVAATYFKQRPSRLLLLTRALLADMNRRNKLLGEMGKSKVTPETIGRLGGLELVVIDELATFTAKNSHEDRDELLENLMQLAAVATGAGIILVLTTQLPQVDVVPGRLAINCGTRWAMRVDTADQSNTILGGGASGSGRDASKFDPPRPGLGWLVNPFAGITDLARSFDLDEDERGEVTQLMERAVDVRKGAGRLAGQWEDPIEAYLLANSGLSSAAGGPDHNGTPGRTAAAMTPEQKAAREALVDAIGVMTALDRDAQLDEMAQQIGGLTAERLGELLRQAGAGPTGKVTIDGRRVQGYRRDALQALLDQLDGRA
jgi:hypothetical protein